MTVKYYIRSSRKTKKKKKKKKDEEDEEDEEEEERAAYNNDDFIFYHNIIKPGLHKATTDTVINSEISSRFNLNKARSFIARLTRYVLQ